jgi:hypothetical protein
MPDVENEENPLIATLKAQYESWDKEQLIEKLVNYDLMWNAIDDTSKYYLENVFQLWRVVKRDYTYMVGFLTKVYFTVESIELQVEEKQEVYGENKIRTEKKTVIFSPKNVLWLEVIRDIEEVPKGDKL